jgi:hypothetical protein
MEKNTANIIYKDDGEVVYEFKGEVVQKLTEEEEKRINSIVGAKGAICMDNKTILIESEPIDYGPIKDLAGNIVENLPQTPKPFVRNSIFH